MRVFEGLCLRTPKIRFVLKGTSSKTIENAIRFQGFCLNEEEMIFWDLVDKVCGRYGGARRVEICGNSVVEVERWEVRLFVYSIFEKREKGRLLV